MPDQEAIKTFLARLYTMPVVADPKNTAKDISALRTTYPERADFEDALDAVLREISHVCNNPEHGKAMRYALDGWRRARFQLRRIARHPADLRLVFRKETTGKTFILAFGPRIVSDSIYFQATSRLVNT